MSSNREPLPEPIHHFHDTVVSAGADQPVIAGEHHGLFPVLKHWAEFNGFGECAFMVKSLFRFWSNATPMGRNYNRDQARATILLRAFGLTFKGDEVGMLGHDIIGKALTSYNVETRDAAIMSLEKWCEDDEDWLTLVAEHRNREETLFLKDYCTQILDSYEWGVVEPDTCDGGGGGDTCDGARFTAGPDYSQDFLEPPPVAPPEVEAFLAVTRPLVANMVEARQFPTEKLPRFLWVGNWPGAHKSLYCWTEEWGVWMSNYSPLSEGDRWHIKLFA